MKKQYELLKDDFIEKDGVKIYRIKYLENISEYNANTGYFQDIVKAGDLGGYILNENILSQDINNISLVKKDAEVWTQHPLGDGAKIHEGASIGPDAIIGKGASIWYGAKIGFRANIRPLTSIGEGASIGPDAKIGDGAIIGYGASIGPDAKIGDGAKIRYCAYIGKGAEIGDGAYIGIGASIDDSVVIEAGCNIKPNARITKSMELAIKTYDTSGIPNYQPKTNKLEIPKYKTVLNKGEA